MDAYEIYNIVPKDGAVNGIHGVILGRKCWISDVRIGHRGLLMVDVDDPDIGPHRIRLSKILRVAGMPGDTEVQIENRKHGVYFEKNKGENTYDHSQCDSLQYLWR